MSAHRKHFVLDSRFQASQKLVQFFLNRGFYLLLAREYKEKEITALPKRLVRDGDAYLSRHELTELVEALEFAKELLQKLNAYLTLHATEEVTLSGEWNYLGQASERDAYLARITRLFWSHQDRDSVKSHPRFAHMLEHPWLLAAHAADFDFPVPAPADTFTPPTIRFVENLLKTLPQWELAPYLITNDDSNFHWRLTLNGAALIQGTISKSPAGTLVHETSFLA